MYPSAVVGSLRRNPIFLFSRRLHSLSIPILIFSLLYLYLMGKGYLRPYFARITMLLFPGFCVLVGIACDDLS